MRPSTRSDTPLRVGSLMQGVDLYAVGQLLGHRTPRMTQRYAHLSPQYMAGAVGKLDSVFGGVVTHLPKLANGTTGEDQLIPLPIVKAG